MKVAITGADGFIGRHVLSVLVNRSVDVCAAIRPNNPYFTGFWGVKSVALDIHEPPERVFALLGCPDVLIHLAWDGLPNYRSLHHFEQELPAQYRFLKMMITSGLKKAVISGTCFEYGMQSGVLAETLPVCPDNPYGFAKNALRSQLEYLKVMYPFDLVWGRLFYLYGEGQADNSIYSQLLKAVKQSDSSIPMSGGEQLRDYLPVTEVARVLVDLALMVSDAGVVNICSGRPISVRNLVEQWIKDNGWQISLELGRYPYPDYEPMAFWGDRQKLDRLLGKY